MSRQLKHTQVQGMEARQGHELILVSHASQLRLKARNRFFVELLAPIEAGRAVVSQQLARKLRVGSIGELPRFFQIRMRSLAPDQIRIGSISQAARNRRLDSA